MVEEYSPYPLVSVLIPAYNHEPYINGCLNSVLNDNYPNKELLIIDDGSSDGTDLRIVDWISRNSNSIQVFYGKGVNNRGVSNTLNTLINKAKGEYIVLLASDDELLPNGIVSRFNYLATNKSKKAVIGDCIVIDDSNNLICMSSLSELYKANLKNYLTDEGLKKEIIWNWSVTGPALMVKKDIYKIIGNYDSRLKIEDWDFYLRMVSNNFLGFINQKVCAYRIHSENCCRKRNNEMMLHVEMVKSALKNLSTFHGEFRRLLTKKILVYLYLILIKKIIKGHDGIAK